MRAPRSIFSQLLLLALASVLPLVLFIGWGIFEQFQKDRQDALRNLTQLRIFAERQIQSYIDTTHHRLERLAYRADELRDSGGNVSELLREFSALNQEYTDVVMADGQGRPIAGVTARTMSSAAADFQEKSYQQALTAPSFFVSNAFKPADIGNWCVLLSHPVFDGETPGKKNGTLLLQLNLPALSRLLAYDPTESRTVLSIADSNGVLIMRSVRAENFIGQIVPQATVLIASAHGQGTGEIPGLDNKIRTYSATTLAGTPWIVTLSIPSSEIYRAAWRNLWQALGLVALALGLVSVLLWRRASTLAQPLTALAAAARAQAAGDTGARAPESGSTELAETARAFNEMVAAGQRAERLLKENERRYRTVVDQTGQIVYDLDVATGGVTWFGNTAIEKITGYTPEEMNQSGLESWKEKLHPVDRADAIARLEDSLRTGEPCHAEYRMRHKDGSYRLIEERGVVLRNDRGESVRMLGCMSDVSGRKQAEVALVRERTLLRQIIDLVPHFIFAKDISGKFVLANQAVADAYGTTIENILGKTDRDFSTDDGEVKHFIADDLEVIRQGRPKTIPDETVTDATGRVRHLSTVKIPFRFGDSETPAVLGVSVDFTDVKKADHARLQIERKLLETQKLESLGVLAGGIAHDFNNLLTGILGNASLARMDLPPTSPLLPTIEQIELSTHRAADLCKQMLAYSGKGRFVVQQLNLNRLVEDTTHLLNISISKNCVLRFNLAPTLPAISVDATQIRQIIMNLVINASEAIGTRSGEIAIATGVARVSQDYIATLLHPGGITEGDYVFLEVSDNGSGMNAATLEKIFDPFFTTKFTGRGLGLAAVLGIIRGHKGAMKVYSEVGRGTTFKILLPCTDTPVETMPSAPPLPDPVWRGQGTVLVVDDEETVRAVTARILATLGFTAVLASDGKEGLDLYIKDPARFTLVLLDLTMPHMDGEETFRQLRQLNPNVRVILMSGFNQQEAISRFTGKGLAGFVQKPFEVGSIMTAVREAFFQS